MLNSQPAVILGAEAYQVMFSLLEIHCYCTEHSTLQVMVIHVLCHFYFQRIWYFSDLEWWAAWDHVHCVTEKEKKKERGKLSETAWSDTGISVLLSRINGSQDSVGGAMERKKKSWLFWGSSRVSGESKLTAAAVAAAVSSTKENPCAPQTQFLIVSQSVFHVKQQILSTHGWREAWIPGSCNGFFLSA